MKLYWSSRSPYARKVMVMAHEAGLADRMERVAVTVTPYSIEPAVLAVNPLGRIPVLVPDEGAPVIGSHAICLLLDDLAERPVSYPLGIDRRRVDRAQALGEGLCDLGIAWVRERWRGGGQAPQDFVAAARTKLAATADVLEREVDDLGGDFHIGGAAIGCALAYLDFRFADEDWRADRPALAGWQQRFAERPSAQATQFHD